MIAAALPRWGALPAVLAGMALLTAASWVKLPMWPVPMTLQTLAVLLIGATAGPRLGASAVLGWMAMGALGLPVMAGGQVLGGPTFGYVMGFVLAAMVVGFGLRRGWNLALVLLLGELAVFLPGLLWLHAFVPGGWQATLAAGLLPFLPGEALKVALAAALLRLRTR